jgi:23S rRNA (cytosine1962-C5)-methyltransferase
MRSTMQHIIIPPSEGYELIDSGNGHRLERIGQVSCIRPEPNVLWEPFSSSHPAWANPDIKFIDKKDEPWQYRKDQFRGGWEVRFPGGIQLLVKPTPFRHLGVFPEQAANWQWIQDSVKKKPGARGLNLFGYTGGASIAAAKAGAVVTHVDASKGTVYWASENARRSACKEESIRWIVDDAMKFIRREQRRGHTYDLIIMDPPVFGRGTKGEIWRLEEDLGELLEVAAALLTKEPLGFLLNFYATSLYPESIARLVRDTVGDRFSHHDLLALCLQESESKKVLQSGFCVRSHS